MNLISCKQCGIVLDKDKIIFPDCRFINCPVCQGPILEVEP